LEVGPRHLTLIERASDLIMPDARWDLFSEPLLRLKSLGIVGIKSSQGYKTIEPRNFVGRMRTASGAIEIRPRNPTWFASLQRFIGSPYGKAVVDLEELESDGTWAAYLELALALSRAVEEAIRVGFPSSYQKELLQTSKPVGRILFTDSVQRFLVKGIRHKVTCQKVRRCSRGDLASVVCLAAELVPDFGVSQTIRRDLSLIVSLLEKEAFGISIEAAISKIDQLASEFKDWPEIVKLLYICNVILQQMNKVWDVEVQLDEGECRFCDVDRLWEGAIFRAVRGSRVRLRSEWHPFAKTSVALLSRGEPEIDPDIVLFDDAGPAIVVDAKNSRADTAVSSDIYQVLCYVERLCARAGVLVYLSTSTNWIKDYGTTERGKRIVAVGINTEDAINGLRLAIPQITSL
jgi:hypothetical protein